MRVQKWTIAADVSIEIGLNRKTIFVISIIHKHKNTLCNASAVVYDSSNTFFVGCVVRHKPTTLSRVL